MPGKKERHTQVRQPDVSIVLRRKLDRKVRWTYQHLDFCEPLTRADASKIEEAIKVLKDLRDKIKG